MHSPTLTDSYAHICTPDLIARSPAARAANWASAKAARRQEIAPDRLARLTLLHDQTISARGRTLGQAMPAVGTVAEQIQPHCQRTQQRIAEIIARRTSGGAA
tara:strand:- start:98 stop:406 length:309 start_codon:yes stop_codon:yes gene_type:complete